MPNKISQAKWQALLRDIKENKSTKLDLSLIGIDDFACYELANALKKNYILTELNLSFNYISSEGSQLILSALKHVPLKKLDLSYNSIGSQGAKAVSEFLIGNKILKEIRLYNNEILSSGILDLANALKKNSVLQFLGIGKNKIGNEGFKALADALLNNSVLKKLDLGRNKISLETNNKLNTILNNLRQNILDIDMARLAEEYYYLKHISPEIEFLDKFDLTPEFEFILDPGFSKLTTEFVHPPEDGLLALADSLKVNKILRSLDLSAVSINPNITKYFIQILQHNNVLVELDLSFNEIDTSGLQELATILKINHTLKRLNLFLTLDQNEEDIFSKLILNRTGDEFIWRVCLIIMHHNLLKHKETKNLLADLNKDLTAEFSSFFFLPKALLSIFWRTSKKTDNGLNIAPLTEALKYNSGLKKLGISGATISKADILALSAALKTSKLQELDLSSLKFSDSDSNSLGSIVTALAYNTNLKKLNLSFNKIKLELIDKLVASLKSNKMLKEIYLHGELNCQEESYYKLFTDPIFKEQSGNPVLNIYKGTVDSSCLLLIADLFKTNSVLECLDLGYAQADFDSNAAKMLSHTLKDNIAISRLFRYNDLEHPVYKEISATLRRNQQFKFVAVHPDGLDWRKILLKLNIQIKTLKSIRGSITTSDGYGIIHLAAWYGYTELVNNLYQIDPTIINLTATNGNTPLHCAALNGHFATVNFLIFLVKEINMPGENKSTALHLAASEGSLKVVKELVTHGADLRLLNERGMTAAELAAENNHLEIAKFLNEQDMILACQEDNLSRVQHLHTQGTPLTLHNNFGYSLWLLAAQSGSVNVIKYMLTQEGIDFQEQDKHGNNALHLIAKVGCVELITPLLGQISLDETNELGQNPFHVAILSRQHGFIETFLKRLKASPLLLNSLHATVKVDIDGKIFLMNTLHIAIMLGDTKIVTKLMSLCDNKQALIMVVDASLGSILHIAVLFNQLSMLKFIFNNASLYIPFMSLNNRLTELKALKGLTPFNLAAQLGRIEILDYLHQQGALIYTQDDQGRTPAHWATIGQHEDALFKLSACDSQHSGTLFQTADFQSQLPSNLAKTLASSKTAKSKRIFAIVNNLSNKIFEPTRIDDYFENLVFQGGGPAGIAYVGALEQFVNQGLSLLKVKRVAGTSAGAITATLLALGYSPQEIKSILDKTSIKSFVNNSDLPKGFLDLVKVYKLDTIKLWYRSFTQDGAFSGEPFRLWAEEQIRNKLIAAGDYDKEKMQAGITFGDLAKLIQQGKPYKHLHMVGTHINDASGVSRQEIFSSENPEQGNMIISDALRISMSIPGVFIGHYCYMRNSYGERVKASDQRVYGDGGMVNNYPVSIFDNLSSQPQISSVFAAYPNLPNKRTLGFSLASPEHLSRFDKQFGESTDKPTTVYGVAKALGQAIYYNELTHFNEADVSRTIFIDNVGIGLTDFDITTEQSQKLIASGKKAVQNFCDKHQDICATNKKMEIAVDQDSPEKISSFKVVGSQEEQPARVGRHLLALESQPSDVEEMTAASSLDVIPAEINLSPPMTSAASHSAIPWTSSVTQGLKQLKPMLSAGYQWLT